MAALEMEPRPPTNPPPADVSVCAGRFRFIQPFLFVAASCSATGCTLADFLAVTTSAAAILRKLKGGGVIATPSGTTHPRRNMCELQRRALARHPRALYNVRGIGGMKSVSFDYQFIYHRLSVGVTFYVITAIALQNLRKWRELTQCVQLTFSISTTASVAVLIANTTLLAASGAALVVSRHERPRRNLAAAVCIAAHTTESVLAGDFAQSVIRVGFLSSAMLAQLLVGRKKNVSESPLVSALEACEGRAKRLVVFLRGGVVGPLVAVFLVARAVSSLLTLDGRFDDLERTGAFAKLSFAALALALAAHDTSSKRTVHEVVQHWAHSAAAAVAIRANSARKRLLAKQKHI